MKQLIEMKYQGTKTIPGIVTEGKMYYACTYDGDDYFTNDEGWDTVFAAWLRTSRASANDAVFVFSVGGGNLEKNVSAKLTEAIVRDVFAMHAAGMTQKTIATRINVIQATVSKILRRAIWKHVL